MSCTSGSVLQRTTAGSLQCNTAESQTLCSLRSLDSTDSPFIVSGPYKPLDNAGSPSKFSPRETVISDPLAPSEIRENLTFSAITSLDPSVSSAKSVPAQSGPAHRDPAHDENARNDLDKGLKRREEHADEKIENVDSCIEPKQSERGRSDSETSLGSEKLPSPPIESVQNTPVIVPCYYNLEQGDRVNSDNKSELSDHVHSDPNTEQDEGSYSTDHNSELTESVQCNLVGELTESENKDKQTDVIHSQEESQNSTDRYVFPARFVCKNVLNNALKN